MKLENQVCSLELAKKLKELGVKQESLFWWCKDFKGRVVQPHKHNCLGGGISAFTVIELLEIAFNLGIQDIIKFDHYNGFADYLATEIINYLILKRKIRRGILNL